MASISWDELTSIADTPEPQLEDGKVYDVVVDEAIFKESGNGHPQFKLVFEIVGGPNAGRTIWHWITAAEHPYSRKMFVTDLRTLLGPDVKLDLMNTNKEEVAAPLFGVKARVLVKIKEREDNGEMQARVEKILPADSAAVNVPAAPAAPSAPVEAAPVAAPSEMAAPPAPIN